MGVEFCQFPCGHMGRPLEFPHYPTGAEVGTMIYVLGRRKDHSCDCGRPHGQYHIQGIFTEVEMAEQAALDINYFIGPLPVNVALPHDTIEWAGLYWPLVAPRRDSSKEVTPPDDDDSVAVATDPVVTATCTSK